MESPAELQMHVGSVLDAVSEGIVDSDEDVRRADYRLMASVILPRLERVTVMPFLPVLMSHICWSDSRKICREDLICFAVG